jgi:hypothetical protein
MGGLGLSGFACPPARLFSLHGTLKWKPSSSPGWAPSAFSTMSLTDCEHLPNLRLERCAELLPVSCQA